MLNKDLAPTLLYRAATDRAVAVVEAVRPDQLGWPTGTFMDVLVHTWDLARATGQDERLDAGLVEACAAMFLPEMPRRGREAGSIGPEVALGEGASAQDRLLAAMGRTP